MGAPVVPDVTFTYDEKHDLMIGKGFDCRMGCASILHTLDNVKGKELKVDVTAAWSVQEEMGTRGASVTCQTVKPDLAIVFEGCPADDTVVEPYMIQTAIHKGPMLRHIDARMITNPRYQRFALNLAEELGIPVQESVRTGGSTNGAPIHLSKYGCAHHRHRHPGAVHPHPLWHRRPRRRGERRQTGPPPSWSERTLT